MGLWTGYRVRGLAHDLIEGIHFTAQILVLADFFAGVTDHWPHQVFLSKPLRV
jgi:hypothetical protein